MRKLAPARGCRCRPKGGCVAPYGVADRRYAFMAFRAVLCLSNVEVSSPEFWLLMQMAMMCVFITSFPVHWRLIRSGIKERM